MASSYVDYTGTGVQTDWTVPFSYIAKSHVKVYVEDVLTPHTWVNASTVRVSPAVTSGYAIRIARETPEDPIVTFENTKNLTSTNLNNATYQPLYRLIEAFEGDIPTAADIEELRSLIELGGEASVRVLSSYAAVLAATFNEGDLVVMLGYETPGDGAGGLFAWLQSSALTANGGTIIRPTAYAATNGRLVRVFDGAKFNVKWFGAKGDGTNDTAAIAAANTAASGRELVFPATATGYKFSEIELNASTAYRGEGKEKVALIGSDNTKSMFSASAKNKIVIENFLFYYESPASSHVWSLTQGCIALLGCAYFDVRNNEFSNFTPNGVISYGSSYGKIRNNRFLTATNAHAAIGLYADTALPNAKVVEVTGNHIASGCWSGVLTSSVDNTGSVWGTLVEGNFIANCQAYGVCWYSSSIGTESGMIDNYLRIIGNKIYNTTGAADLFDGVSQLREDGTTGVGRQTGMAIYLLNCGGATIAGNQINGTCSLNNITNLGPGAISIALNSDATTALAEHVITGNEIVTSHKHGIFAGGGKNGGVISGNSITLNDGGAAPDGALAYGNAIYVVDARDWAINGNKIRLPSTVTRHGIRVVQTSIDGQSINIASNVVVGDVGTGIWIEDSDPYTIGGSLVGNTVRMSGSNAGAIAMLVDRAAGMPVVGNNLLAYNALIVSDASAVRASGNVLSSNASGKRITTTGTCSDCLFDDTNAITADTQVSNGASGSTVRVRLSSVPTGGTWQQGDRWEKTNSTANSAPGGYCTAAGTPGTWKTMAILAA